MLLKPYRWIAWFFASLLAMVLLCCAWIVVVVYSFDTETLPPRHGKFDLVWHAGPQEGAPLLVTFGGSEGGNMWNHPRWRAERESLQKLGFGVLTVGYFGSPTTPEYLDRIDLGVLHERIRQHMQSPGVQSRCLALMGGSKGAELVLAMAANFNDIDAVVALSPSDTVFPAHNPAMTTSSWSNHGKPLPFAPLPWSTTLDLLRGNIGGVMTRTLAQPEAEAARIPIEKSSAKLLLVASENDEMWPALMMAKRITSRIPERATLLAVPGDHMAVTRHMDKVEDFLREQVLARPQCQPAGSQG